MDKNVYEIIKDWHKLLKNGVISEDEFNARKNFQVLKKNNIEAIKNEPKIITETINTPYDNHEVIYEEESFFQNIYCSLFQVQFVF